jgi:hypothetical protein
MIATSYARKTNIIILEEGVSDYSISSGTFLLLGESSSPLALPSNRNGRLGCGDGSNKGGVGSVRTSSRVLELAPCNYILTLV